ncbi:hypothetical protein F0224_25545 [Vibrio coralliilyticus]|uniref:hypothetical protein n=1 Tax=Vibrio coralliilyticus TaxID=190893 RepID=UPI000BAC2790|nr:hypothetical protein [Vibrio coralliilyticus]NOI79008.1 hypothetical protein [Vibrio coralliilyticus]PAW00861.1 hypothetical protein CKJ79_24445 [Vibrio coralliilyticus]
MKTTNANKYQPNICSSLASAWIKKMMISEVHGQLWCAEAYGAEPSAVFYDRHREDQKYLGCIEAIDDLIEIGETLYGYQESPESSLVSLDMLNEILHSESIAELSDDIEKGIEQNRRLEKLRQVEVVKKYKGFKVLGLLGFMERATEDRDFYLMSVKIIETGGHHTIAFAIIRSDNKCYIHYYDPNEKKVYRFTKGTGEFERYCQSTIAGTYSFVNSVTKIINK